MFIAMNNFKIVPGKEQEFEEVWKNRETHLQDVPGIVRFALLRGDTQGEYVSHSTWAHVLWLTYSPWVSPRRSAKRTMPGTSWRWVSRFFHTSSNSCSLPGTILKLFMAMNTRHLPVIE